MTEPLVEIKHLRKFYGNFEVLSDINLTINEGDIYGLVGKSGAGKSTLLRCINGLESFDAGSIQVLGEDIQSLSGNALRHLQKEIGMIFQQFELINRKTVRDNVALPLKLWNIEENDQRIQSLLDLVDMSAKADAYPGKLSGGQKQRVGIARALSLNPKLLLSDEATSALDPSITRSIIDLLQEINQKLKLTIIVVTHEIEVVKKICNKVAILENGKIVAAVNTVDLFLDQPPALRRLMGLEEETEPQVEAGHFAFKLVLPNVDQQKDLLSRIFSDLQIPYTIEDAHYEEINDRTTAYFKIQLAAEHRPVVESYLKDHQIEWRE
ncbi:ATP-binding cassette domain-containing protein [Aerococcus urinae]|uniref:methionine ABC transporter ATP-binding protein n=1 Tax=Aerococcus urinae TaxID=1376 RepID=UPI00227D2A66|nr:ATP-binding cassette domain-containing protein [Aerococcus urinae]MCY3045694.1 ATP-binding cassette domain-containing protein [Aerococcus urinae]